MEDTIRQIMVWALPVLAAVVFHEVAHGWVAFRLGDPTAARLGRLTLNPLAHVDLYGTIIIPLVLIISHAPFLFGYAKPVPINFHNLRNPKRDMVWVALAGPAMNLFLALGCILFLKAAVPLLASMAGGSPDSALVEFFTPVAVMARNGVLINIALAVFNAFPLPPLDGGRVLVGLLPEPQSSLVARLEPFGFLILFALLMTRALDDIIDVPTHFLIKLYFSIL